LIFETHDSGSTCHKSVRGTLAKALDIFWRKRIRQDVKDLCERRVVCRRANIQPHVPIAINPLHVPPRPWQHTFGLDYLRHLHVRHVVYNVLIVAYHLTRMAHCLPCVGTITSKENANCFFKKSKDYMVCLASDRDPKFVIGFWEALWRRLGTRLNMSFSRHP
jgi:hypothetical protein